MIKIGILGPESSGKSVLAAHLAELYNAHYEAEFARSYVENLKLRYAYSDVVNIAQHQIAREYLLQSELNENELVFFDTELIITKVWFEQVYGICPAFVKEYLEENPMDFYLLCAPDLPWENDPVRENEHLREFLFDWYKQEVENLQKPYAVVQGMDENRIKCAQNAFEEYLKEL